MLDLYEASAKEEYLLLALRLQKRQDGIFWDEEGGGYFTSVKDEHVLLRSKDAQDGAEPSAQSITLSNLARLSHYDTSPSASYTSKIERIAALCRGIYAAARRPLRIFDFEYRN